MRRGRRPNSLRSSSAGSRPAATTRSPAATCTPSTTTSTSCWGGSTRSANATSTPSGFAADPGVRGLLEGPRLGEPAGDELSKRAVAACVRGAHPRLDDGVVRAVPVRIDVDAADHVAVRRVEDRVGEAGSLREVAGMALEVRAILLRRHRARPATVREPRRGADVLDRGRPRLVVGLVVLGAERLEQEMIRNEPSGGWKSSGTKARSGVNSPGESP